MHQNFELFFKRVLEDEGTTYEDVPGDNGGPTKCGITIADVARFNGVHCPGRGGRGWDDLVAKVRALDPITAGVIYKKFYWDEVRADDLPGGLDYAVVDYAVNSGTGRAIPTLGHLVGVTAKTVTDEMLKAVNAYGNLQDLITHFQEERRAFLVRIAENPGQRKFRTGWLSREERVRKIALDLSRRAEPLRPMTAALPKPMDVDGIVVAPPSTTVAAVVDTAQSRTLWGILVGSVSLATDWLKPATKFIGDLFTSLGDIKDNVDSLVSPAASLLEMLQLKSGKIVFAIGVAALLVASCRYIEKRLA